MRLQTVFRRRELKYLITVEQKRAVMDAMQDRIRPDEYGRSTICNLYFDTPDYLLIRRSLEHPVYKEKLRLRSYGTAQPGGKLFGEIKKKYKGVVYKRRISIPTEREEEFLSGRYPQQTQIAREIGYFFTRYRDLRPRVFLSYEREAYYGVEDFGFRVTFDDHIYARTEDLSLSAPVGGTSLLPDGMVLMEVKCVGAMPLWMTHLLSEQKLYKASYSKYGTAYGLMRQNLLHGGYEYVR